MQKQYTYIYGGVTAPDGYKAGAIKANIKYKDRFDMALIVSETSASVAGVFTTNKIQAAPVRLCKKHVAYGHARAVLVNSGFANACTGEAGALNALKMAQLTAVALGVDTEEVLVCSTGTIGVQLPMDRIEIGINSIVDVLSLDGGDVAANAIMTTDTVSKQVAIRIKIDGKTVTIGGMAKGAGMIDPNMATMLAFMTTDAAVESKALQKCLSDAAKKSFNRITIDGDQSTNDTLILLANGVAGNIVLNESHPEWKVFVDAVNDVALQLALKIVRDGEGATKFVTVTVRGAVSDDDATKACRAIANSLLVKTSWFGQDPNWGRIVDAVGYSGADVNECSVDIYYDDICAVRNGCVAGDSALRDLEEVLRKSEFTITVDLRIGSGSDTVYTCDCSEEYVKINSEYTT